MPDPRLLIATNNAGKTAELRTLLAGCGWEIVTPADIGLSLSDDETGAAYADNASDKAQRAAAASNMVTLADDSGIEIEALDGEPGVHSARFLGRDATYEQRFAEIERQLAGVPPQKRQARFVCVIAIVDPKGGAVRLAEGEVRGLIAAEPAGDSGFGYDPIFWLPQQSLTMAQLPQHQKDIISHRARAVAIARQALHELHHEYEPDPDFAPASPGA